jgi:hypothetical protein
VKKNERSGAWGMEKLCHFRILLKLHIDYNMLHRNNVREHGPEERRTSRNWEKNFPLLAENYILAIPGQMSPTPPIGSFPFKNQDSLPQKSVVFLIYNFIVMWSFKC